MTDPVAPPPHPTLFLVDGYALIYRAFFAMLSRPLRTARGENTSAAWGVVNFVQRMLERHGPDHVAWVHDAGRSFRHEMFPAYKATREKLTEELQADFDQGLRRIDDLLAAYHIPVIAKDGYEADDVIGTLAKLAVDRGMHVVIVSGDKDFHQLVRPGVWLLNPGRGGPAAVDEHWVSEANGSERLGVPPQHVTDYLALVGDSSDNVPGVKGIGDKTAQELVSTWGDLESILAHTDEVPRKRAREALHEQAAEARLSKELVTIREDVPVTLDLDALRRGTPDTTRLRQLFVELEFSSLLRTLDRLEPAAPKPGVDTPAGPPTGATHPVTIVATPDEVSEVVARVRAAGACTMAVQTANPGGDALRTHIVGIGLAIPDAAWYLPFRHRTWRPPQGDLLSGTTSDDAPEGQHLAAKAIGAGVPDGIRNLPDIGHRELAPLRALLEDPGMPKSGHDLKRAVLVFRSDGVALRGCSFDTMLASYVLDPGRRDHTLTTLSIEFLSRGMTSHETLRGRGKTELPFEMVPLSLAGQFTAEETVAVRDLQQLMEPQLKAMDADTLFREIELPLLLVLADMEWTGVAIDVSWFRSLKQRFQRERERVETQIYEAAGERFNINSNPQLRALLFDKLGLPVKKKTATGPSTDATVLQELADEGHALPSLLMEYRELAKLESTYLDTLPELILPRDGRLHTSYNQTVAATGRLSSSDPNLQNIPIRRELGRDIRRGFVAAPGHVLVAADYSQIELRLLAHLSQDAAFVQAFRSGGDIHVETAAIIFGVPGDLVTPEMRARAKTINFATIYGQGAHALSRQLKISNAEAKAFIATYFERFRGVREYLDGMVTFAREHGYVETIFHRRRYIPELKDRNFNMRAFGERVATNAPIQGSAADLIKIAMLRIHERLLAERPEAHMTLQVHDELVLETPAELAEAVTDIVRRSMQEAARLSVPLVVDLGVGPDWVSAKE